MTNLPTNISSVWNDFDLLSAEAISLSPDVINQAVQLSTQIPNEQRQWYTYLNALALFSFEQWLEERVESIRVNRDNCSLLQSATANVIEAPCNLDVNGFKLCIIATGSLTDDRVSLPRAAVDLPEFIPHFYVLVDVQEEQETAVISGYLSYQQLVEYRATIAIEADADWTYQLPLSWFESDPDRMLLYLRCLEPEALPLPVPPNRTATLEHVRGELLDALPQLQSRERQLWQVLDWEQGIVVLTHPELLDWVYQVQEINLTPETLEQPGDRSRFYQTSLKDLLELVTRPAINVGRWLNEELDELAQQLSWVLLPNLTPASEMRAVTHSVEEEFAAIIEQLKSENVEIPPEACGAYRDLHLAGVSLQLYAVTWPVESESVPEWTLLLVLGTHPDSNLPPGLNLRVSDHTGVLVEQELEATLSNSYVFTSVVGRQDEKFVVTISADSGIEETLPPFSFQRN